MIDEKLLTKYAELVLKIGVNLQKGQGLEIACPVEKPYVAEIFTKVAYQVGASIVRVRWQNEIIDKINYLNADVNALKDVPNWFVDSKNDLIKRGFCYVAIASDDPEIFKDVPPEKLAEVSKARSLALKKFSDGVMSNQIRWCVVSVPTKSWAQKVFPNSTNAEDELLKAICTSMRLYDANPVESWKNHIATLEKRATYLNKMNFEYLHCTSNNGTNLKVGLCTDHVWLSANEKAQDGVDFVANMPTEEVFTAPHKMKVDGVVKSALALCDNGQIIDDFTLEFKKGKIVNYSAKVGYDNLKRLIETDNGTKRIGEVAIIGKSSPISQLNMLFYNTLFDENASCHLALGKAYPTTVKNGDKLTKKQLSSLGANDSIEHVDFMIGCQDTKIEGITYSGEKVLFFDNGDWII